MSDKSLFLDLLFKTPTNILPEIKVYSDGACSGNPGPGGWGAILILHGQEYEISGGEVLTTNNRMEMMAAIAALKFLENPCHVTIVTDSQYLKDGITHWIKRWLQNNWRTSTNQPVKNQDLWEELHTLCNHHKVTWEWVKGHSNDHYNDRADSLAKSQVLKAALTGS